MTVELTILGSGAAFPTLKRGATSQWLQIRNSAYLIDCGEGTQRAILANGLRTKYLSAIFISHLHGDHLFGLPGFISSMDLMGREKELVIVGPSGLKEYLESCHVLPYRYSIRFIEIDAKSDVVYEDHFVNVRTSLLDHRLPCYGFRFDEKRKPNIRKDLVEKYDIPGVSIPSIIAGADWNFNNSIIPNKELLYYKVPPVSYGFITDTKPLTTSTIFNKVDVLYHEATFTQEHVDRAAETYHSTASQAAYFAQSAGVGHLLLGHFSPRYDHTDIHLAEAQLIFERSCCVADGDRYQIEPS